MRYLLISDIHGNLEALEAVLAAAGPRGYDRVLVLGDLVGYGADPNAVVDRVRELGPEAVIRGNHDKVAAGLEEGEGFNSTARNAIRWTHDTLSPDNRAYLAALPTGPVTVDDAFEICHGSPYDEDAYIFDELDALKALASSSQQVCVFGHTHVPLVFCRTSDSLELLVGPGDAEARVIFQPGVRYLVNPGAVGQPRDGDPRAAAGILDTDTRSVELFRVEYPVPEAQQKITAAGLPDVLARRLALGR